MWFLPLLCGPGDKLNIAVDTDVLESKNPDKVFYDS